MSAHGNETPAADAPPSSWGRVAEDGTVPAGNPFPDSLEWCRGFRNPFAIAFVPGSGFLFATENGENAHDELDYVLPGRNYKWGAPDDADWFAIELIEGRPVPAPPATQQIRDRRRVRRLRHDL